MRRLTPINKFIGENVEVGGVFFRGINKIPLITFFRGIFMKSMVK